MLDEGLVESRREVTIEMSRVREAKMLILRVCGRMSEMESVMALGSSWSLDDGLLALGIDSVGPESELGPESMMGFCCCACA